MRLWPDEAGFKFYGRDQHRALRVQLHLQTRNLEQVKAKYAHPIDEAVASTFTQGNNLTNVWRNLTSQLVKEGRRNEVGRSVSVELLCTD